jgi:hypothetical protein
MFEIIILPDEANYSYQEVLNVLFHAVISPTIFIKYATKDLSSKIPKIKIPSANTP